MDPASLRDARTTWDRIAPSFDATRDRAWPPVVEFLRSLPPDARVLDAGVGNGRHAREAVRMGLRTTGLDLSLGLLKAARSHSPETALIAGAIDCPPLKPSRFDAVVLAAVLHHVRGRGHRVAALRALHALVRPGGAILVTVWSHGQPRFQTTTAPKPARGLPVETGDALVAWRRDGLDEARFVHLYELQDVVAEVMAAGFRVERAWSEALGGPDVDNHLVRACVD